MSKTIVDMAKVTQMLDNGWTVLTYKNLMGSYTAEGRHRNRSIIKKANEAFMKMTNPEIRDIVEDDQSDTEIVTDDFTPEQALTRLAYKVGGTILES